MIAERLLSDSIIPLRTSDTGDEALGMMSDFGVRHLPIVNNEELLGLLSEDDVLNFDAKEAVGSYSLSLLRPYVFSRDHIYELMRQLAQSQLTLIPVVDDDNRYLGVVTLEDLLRYFAQTTSFAEPGSILVLEMSKRDYMLSEIARIVESESAQVISSYITSHPDSAQLEVTLKINRQNIQTILATFERFDYDVKATFNEAEYMESLKDRYDALMTYLNV